MSTASYIIICAGRIELAAARNGTEQIKAASGAAMNLVTYYGDKLSDADTKPISQLQHAMMDRLTERGLQGSDDLVDEMFALLDALERKFS
jgi:adenosylmethionine-8-amino-7-oxononanoate aminotransferase